jgi:peptide/nickel transport system permease protein
VFNYIIRRLLQLVLVLFGITVIVFGVMFLSGDPAMLMVGEGWSSEEIAEFREQMGFDRPWYVQYVSFMSGVVQGDFGHSLRQREPAMGLVLERMPATIQLAASAMAISIIIAVPVGVISAVKRNSAMDNGAMFFALLGQSIPNFWLGLLLILLFGVTLGWLPFSGRGDISNLVLPAITLGMFSTAQNARVIRSSMLEVLHQDYIRTARAKGLRESKVIYLHGLRNTLIPFVTLLGLQIGVLLGGSIVVETVFAWPGVGRLMITSIHAQDFPVVQAAVMLLSVIVVATNLIVDIAYSVLDPRIRYS